MPGRAREIERTHAHATVPFLVVALGADGPIRLIASTTSTVNGLICPIIANGPGPGAGLPKPRAFGKPGAADDGAESSPATASAGCAATVASYAKADASDGVFDADAKASPGAEGGNAESDDEQEDADESAVSASSAVVWVARAPSVCVATVGPVQTTDPDHDRDDETAALDAASRGPADAAAAFVEGPVGQQLPAGEVSSRLASECVVGLRRPREGRRRRYPRYSPGCERRYG